MLIGGTFAIVYYSGVTSTPDAVGGVLVGIALCAWVMGWKRMK